MVASVGQTEDRFGSNRTASSGGLSQVSLEDESGHLLHMANRLEPSWFSVQPTEATTLLLSTPDRSESPQSAVVAPPPTLMVGGAPKGATKLLDPFSSPEH